MPSMCRLECEQRLAKLMQEALDIYRQFDPDGRGLVMSVFTDGMMYATSRPTNTGRNIDFSHGENEDTLRSFKSKGIMRYPLAKDCENGGWLAT